MRSPLFPVTAGASAMACCCRQQARAAISSASWRAELRLRPVETFLIAVVAAASVGLGKATIVDIDERRPGVAGRVLDREASAGELPDIKDLLCDYLPGRGTTGPALDRVMAAFAHLQAEPDPEDPAPCCEETLLAAAIAGLSLDGVDRSGLLADGTGSEAAR